VPPARQTRFPAFRRSLRRRGPSGRAKPKRGNRDPDLLWFAENSRPGARSSHRREPGDFRVASREPATAEQRESALALAREVFSQHGIAEALLPKVRAEYVTRTYLAPSPRRSLIGSCSLDSGSGDNEGLVHHLFFIASQPDEKLEPGFVWIHLSESEMDEELLRLVDHADLLGNGQDELVTKLVSLQTQTHRYVIFRRTKDGAHWEQILKTEPLGCSS
jgi:hypothetical protein